MHPKLTRLLSIGTALSFLIVGASLADGKHRAGRLAPPAGLDCDRNALTAYTGTVGRYERTPRRIHLTILTDWDTRETVNLECPDCDLTRHFLLQGRSFPDDGLQAIETPDGHLKPGMRVTAWICEDGTTQHVIDWQPGSRAE